MCPPCAILLWNKHEQCDIKSLFGFAYANLHDNASMLLFLLKSQVFKDDVRAFAPTHAPKLHGASLSIHFVLQLIAFLR